MSRDGYRAFGVGSGEEALERLAAESFDVVVSDVSMPGISGLELLREIKRRDPRAEVIIMTAHAEVQFVVAALRAQADDYLLKPFDVEQLVHSVGRCVEHRRLQIENQHYREHLEDRVREQARRIEAAYLAGIRALIAALEARDPRTRGHSDRVTRYALAIGQALDGVDQRALAVGAALHDIGKIGTRDDVLGKPGALAADEVAHIREHPVVGVRILSPMLDDPQALGVVRHHHEHWNGTGYPDGIAGRQIPLLARIVAVADALDAITSARAYRPVRSWDAALDEIAACAGTQFDPEVVAAARATLRERPGLAAGP